MPRVDSGGYPSASVVIREALRLLEECEQARTAQLKAFNQELALRLSGFDRGERLDPAKVREQIQRRLRERGKRIA